MSKAKIIGELAVVAYKARDLPNREIVGKQDPFVIFRLAEVNKKTKTDYRGGQHPVWDDQVNLPVPDKKRILTVQVYDEDSKREELISECEVDLTKVLEEGEYDDWFPLTFKSKPAGKIYLEMTFYSARPPPQRQPTRYGKNTRPQPVHSTPLATSTPAVNNQPYPPDSIRPNIPQSESQSTPTFNTPIPQAQSTYPLQYPPFHAPGNQYLPPSTSTPVVNQAHTSSYPTPSLPGHSQLSPYPTPSLPGQSSHYSTPSLPGQPSPYSTPSLQGQPSFYSTSQQPSFYRPPMSNGAQSSAYPTQSSAYPTQSSAYPTQSSAYPTPSLSAGDYSKPSLSPGKESSGYHKHSLSNGAQPSNPLTPTITTMSNGLQHIRPPQALGSFNALPENSSKRPNSYHSGLGGSNAFDNNSSVHAPLLSSSYTPAQKPYPPQGNGYPMNNGYQPYLPPSNPQRYSFPSNSYVSQSESLGTPFAAHQGSFVAPQQQNSGFFPNNGAPPSSNYPPPNGYNRPNYGNGYPPY